MSFWASLHFVELDLGLFVDELKYYLPGCYAMPHRGSFLPVNPNIGLALC